MRFRSRGRVGRRRSSRRGRSRSRGRRRGVSGLRVGFRM